VLTGATGFIGSHVLAELREHGHEVTTLVRDDAQASAAAARGATPVVIDLYDRPAVARVLSGTDGAIHTASPGDATSANLDSAVGDAVTDAFTGTGKPYLQISGLWIYGANPSITEASAFNAPAMVSGRSRSNAGCSARQASAESWSSPASPTVTAPVGFPGLLLSSPRDDAGNLIMLGTGQQHWSTVHVADRARQLSDRL
jgi:uncharacterized protein YbjT (DUF2867 family)